MFQKVATDTLVLHDAKCEVAEGAAQGIQDNVVDVAASGLEDQLEHFNGVAEKIGDDHGCIPVPSAAGADHAQNKTKWHKSEDVPINVQEHASESDLRRMKKIPSDFHKRLQIIGIVCLYAEASLRHVREKHEIKEQKQVKDEKDPAETLVSRAVLRHLRR